MANLTAFLVGIIFAVGLGIGGMTQPGKVVGFLDVFGKWDPALIFVMIGALSVHTVLYQIIRKRRSPLLAEKFHVPTRKDIDRKLIAGSVIFGSGWGLAGYCPAPAITSLATLQVAPAIFAASMIAGMVIFQLTSRTKA